MNTLETRNMYEPPVSRQRPATATQSAPRSQGAKKANMPKAQALALTQKLKNGLVVASVLCFGSLGGFLVGHSTLTTTVTTTATQQTAKTSQASATSSSQASNPSNTSSTSSSQQQGGSNFGSTSTNQAPVSGSSTS